MRLWWHPSEKSTCSYSFPEMSQILNVSQEMIMQNQELVWEPVLSLGLG